MLPYAPEGQRVENFTLGLCVAAGYLERAMHTAAVGSAPVPGHSVFDVAQRLMQYHLPSESRGSGLQTK